MAGIEGPDPSTLTDGSGDAVVYLDDDGLLHSDWPVGCIVTIEHAIRAVERVNRFCLDRKYPVLVTMVGVASIDRQTIPIWKELDPAKIAVVGDTPVDRVIVNFTLVLSTFRCPARYFTERDAALQWLREGDHA